MLLLMGFSLAAYSQKLSIKSNLLYGGVAQTPNIGIEFSVSPSFTLDMWGGYNPWNLKGKNNNNKKLVHWIAMPEIRYWFYKNMGGHFIGLHGIASMYNISGHKIPMLFEKEYRYQGNAFGGGLSYGYHLMLNRSWGFEFTIGGGYMRLDYDKYYCPKCGQYISKESKNYFGLTRAGITLLYLIK